MAPKAKLKTPAQTYAPQTTDDCAADIHRLGEMHRAYLRDEAAMNDEIAAITQRYQPILSQARTTMDEIQKGVQTFCEAHRHKLTEDGKTKTGNFVTGSVQWRQRPPSVSVRGMESVIDTLRRLGLAKFLRVKEEVNKEAILNEPDLVRGVAGITVVTGVEDFVITPFEAKTEGAA